MTEPHNGTHRNWHIVGLTPQNTVVLRVGDNTHDSGEKPSEFGVDGLRRTERGILRRGLTPGGNDREQPRGLMLKTERDRILIPAEASRC